MLHLRHKQNKTNGGAKWTREFCYRSEDKGVVNLYTSRHYDTDTELYQLFTEQTGIKVNVVEGKGDELMERLKREGESTEADYSLLLMLEIYTLPKKMDYYNLYQVTF